MQSKQSPTLIIDNFSGLLTRRINGDINSGLAKYLKTHGVDSFTQPGNLRFMDSPVDITGNIITDCIVAMRERVENGDIFVYAIGHTGKLYKIQTNDFNNHFPVKDQSVLLTTLVSGSPTFQYGSSIEFYTVGSTEYIFIGHDLGVTRVNFDGTGETPVTGAWVLGVPRYSQQFIGSMFFLNGNNIAQIDSTGLLINATVLSPSIPSNQQARDIDITADNTYIVISSSRIPQYQIFATTFDTNSIAQGDSLISYWNGIDLGITTGTTLTGFVQTAYNTFANKEFGFSYDARGASMADPANKKLTMFATKSPLTNALFSNGNMMGWVTPEFVNSNYQASIFQYGNLDSENPLGLYRFLRLPSTLTNGDVVACPASLLITNNTFASTVFGYNGYAGYGRMYFSTYEYNGSVQSFKLYTYYIVPAGVTASVSGVYETQTQLFSKSVRVSECRVYMEPPTVGMAFQVDLIGINGSVIQDTTKIFSVAANTMSVNDLLPQQYNPTHQPSTAIGLRITNLGSVTPIIHKVELDTVTAGK